MKRIGRCARVLRALLLVAPVAAAAQQDIPGDVKDEFLAAILDENQHELRNVVAEYASQRIDFLDISYVEPSGDGSEGGFTVAYKWNAESHEQSLATEDGRFRLRRTSWGIDIDGSYAFDDAANNTDLSTVTANFSLQRGDFGRVRSYALNGDAAQDCLVRVQDEFPQPTDQNDDAAWKKYREDVAELENACWIDNGLEDFGKANDNARFYGIDFHAALEGDQNYSDTNVVFGLSGMLAFQPSAENEKFNIFDLPFRLIRQGFTEDSNYVAAFPSVKIDIDRVDGSENEIRSVLTPESDYTRSSAEVAFQTMLASIDGQPIRFNMSYRYFHEFSAPAAVEAAGLDSFDYVEASLRFPARMLPFLQTDEYEFFVSYTDGQLPFDTVSDSAVEIGFATNISQLARLFDN